MRVRYAPVVKVAGEMRFGTWQRGVAAVDDRDGGGIGGISGAGVECFVRRSDDVFVREIEEVFDVEMVGGFLVGIAFLRRELGVSGATEAAVDEIRSFHWSMVSRRVCNLGF